jgi:hypothetical protein
MYSCQDSTAYNDAAYFPRERAPESEGAVVFEGGSGMCVLDDVG